ncbi:uncharacterized protein G2W53_013867 [Senna tora]|uniref:Uncharacterized protein n=1 Tax=Senna tora TaxID=362788 RepID=A0A834U0E5_9FABA|nr:uncharacterized protein G2W53_013867 [Senna tora]
MPKGTLIPSLKSFSHGTKLLNRAIMINAITPHILNDIGTVFVAHPHLLELEQFVGTRGNPHRPRFNPMILNAHQLPIGRGYNTTHHGRLKLAVARGKHDWSKRYTPPPRQYSQGDQATCR